MKVYLDANGKVKGSGAVAGTVKSTNNENLDCEIKNFGSYKAWKMNCRDVGEVSASCDQTEENTCEGHFTTELGTVGAFHVETKE